jgi:hypothetical protein
MYVWPHVLLCRIKQLHVCTQFKFILYFIFLDYLYGYRYDLVQLQVQFIYLQITF